MKNIPFPRKQQMHLRRIYFLLNFTNWKNSVHVNKLLVVRFG